MGIDSSTKSIAYSIMNNRRPRVYGKVDLDGTIEESCGEANRLVYELMNEYNPDFVAVEQPIYVNNKSVMAKLAMIVGSIVGVVVSTHRGCAQVAPSTWMSYIDNPTRNTKKIRDKAKRKFPDKSKSYRRRKMRNWRKQRTLDTFNDKFGLELEDDDIGDAVGVSYYAYWELTYRD